MFETIGNLITIVIWIVAIFLFGGGLFICGMNLFTGSGWEKFWAVVAIILGIIVFTKFYAWLESVVWCLMGSGIVLGLVGNVVADSKEEPAPQKQKEPGFIRQLTGRILEDEREIAIIEEAIRRSKK